MMMMASSNHPHPLQIKTTVDPGTYSAVNVPRPSYNTFFDRYNHKEYMWVHSGTDIDFYDISDRSNFDQVGNPTLAYTIGSGSSCAQGVSFVIGEDVYTYHGDVPFCTCNWRPEAPCPSRLSVTIDGSTELVSLGINNIVNVDTVVPDVTGPAAFAIADESDGSPASWGCTELVNPEEIEGKWCLADRGGCFFQTKYDNCMAAGALATIVVNRDASTLTMQVRDIAENDILIMIGKPFGDTIRDAVAAGQDVELSAGRSVGPPEPLPEYSSPDPLGVVNAYTGKRDLDSSPFILADDILVDWQRKLMYVLSIDGNIPEVNLVMNYTTVEGGTYPVLGSFATGAENDGSEKTLFYQGDKVFMTESASWINTVNIYDLNGDNAADPQLISTAVYDQWCPEATMGGAEIHPSGEYMYITTSIRETQCGDYDGDGDDGDYITEIWDIKDPSNPKKVGTFEIDEVEFGALTRNGSRWEWGPNGLTGISMTSSGFILYDFSDPLNPVPASEIYDPAENTNDFTKGVFASRYGDDGFWYVYEKDGTDGEHGEFHQLKAVKCGTPDFCLDY